MDISKQLEKQEQNRQLAEARSLRKPRSPRHYKELTMFPPNKKDELVNDIQSIKQLLRQWDKNNLEKMCKIGELAKSMSTKLKNQESSLKFSLRSLYKEHFGKDIRRINDCMALFRASEEIKNNSLPACSLILIGQGLGSKNRERRNTAIKIIDEINSADYSPTTYDHKKIKMRFTVNSSTVKDTPISLIKNESKEIQRLLTFFKKLNQNFENYKHLKNKKILNKILMKQKYSLEDILMCITDLSQKNMPQKKTWQS